MVTEASIGSTEQTLRLNNHAEKLETIEKELRRININFTWLIWISAAALCLSAVSLFIRGLPSVH